MDTLPHIESLVSSLYIPRIISAPKRRPTDDLDQYHPRLNKTARLHDHLLHSPSYERPRYTSFTTNLLPPLQLPVQSPIITNNSKPSIPFGFSNGELCCSTESVGQPSRIYPRHTDSIFQDRSDNRQPLARQNSPTIYQISISGLPQEERLPIDEELQIFKPDRHPVRVNLGWHRQENVFFRHPERLPKSQEQQKQATPVPDGVRIIGWQGSFRFGRLYLGFQTNKGLYTWLDKTVAEDMQHFVSEVLLVTKGYSRVERARNVFGLLDKCVEPHEQEFRDQVHAILQSGRVVITHAEFLQPGSPIPNMQDIQPSDIYFDMCLLAVMYKIMERSPERFVEREGCRTTTVIFGHSLEDWFRSWTACRLFRIRRRPAHSNALFSSQGPSKEEDLDCFGYRK